MDMYEAKQFKQKESHVIDKKCRQSIIKRNCSCGKIPNDRSILQCKIGSNAKTGDFVFNKNTLDMYKIIGKLSNGNYKLMHNVKIGQVIIVSSFDDDYDVYLMENNTPTLTTSSIISKDNGSDNQDIFFVNMKNKIIENEKKYPQYFPLYNAASLGVYFLHELIKMIYESSNEIKTENHAYFRNPYFINKKNLHEIRTTDIKKDTWTDHAEKSIISTNIALNANDQNQSEGSWRIFQNNGLFNPTNDKVKEIIHNVLKHFGYESLNGVNDFYDFIMNMTIHLNEKKHNRTGVLYQIFMPKNQQLVSELTYVSGINGWPISDKRLSLRMKSNESTFSSNIINGISRSENKNIVDDTFKENTITYSLLKAAQSISFWENFPSGDYHPQIRLYMDVDKVINPKGIIKTFPYLSKNNKRKIKKLINLSEIKINFLIINRISEMVKHIGYQSFIWAKELVAGNKPIAYISTSELLNLYRYMLIKEMDDIAKSKNIDIINTANRVRDRTNINGPILYLSLGEITTFFLNFIKLVSEDLKK